MGSLVKGTSSSMVFSSRSNTPLVLRERAPTLRGTLDPVDVYLGPHADAKIVHVVHMNDANGAYDEDKSFLGFKNQKAVIDAFKKHYPDGTARIGAITSHRVAGFRQKVRLNKLQNQRGETPGKLSASQF
jgi:hypothetical protein